MAIEIDSNTTVRLLFRRGSNAEKNSIILAQGEPGYALDTKTLNVGDGITPGGNKIPSVDDSSLEWANTAPDYVRVKDKGISNSKLADVAANSVKGNNTAATDTPADIPVSANSLVGRVASINSGNLASISLSVLFDQIFTNTPPDPTITNFWINTNNSIAYQYDGVNWLGRHRYAPGGNERTIYVGSGASINTYDGGDTNTPSVSAGPMWEIDTAMAARFPVGVGTFANAGVVAVTDTETDLGVQGEDVVALDETKIPDHTHEIILNKIAPDSGGLDRFGNGDSGGTPTPVTFTTEATGGGAAPTHNNLPPFYSVYFLKRTSRVYYVE